MREIPERAPRQVRATRASVLGGRPRWDLGLTALEMLIVVVILGIVTTLAWPPMTEARRQYYLDAATYQVASDLNLARIEAIKRNSSVYFAKTGASTYTVQHVGTRSLDGNVAFTAGPDSVKFASFGPPITGAATFTLELQGRTTTVRVNAAGFVGVVP